VAITRWDPFGEVLSMQREMDRLFGRIGGRSGETGGQTAVWLPRIDVKSTGEDMLVYAELPGLNRDDIDIEITDGILSIKGERKQEAEESGEGWLVRERTYGMFERSIALPNGVEPEQISADYKDGVLEVRVPRAMEALKPKTHRVALGVESSE